MLFRSIDSGGTSNFSNNQNVILGIISGIIGEKGSTGFTGATGFSGATGLTGATGTGFTGATGFIGATGAGGVISYYGAFYDDTTQTNVYGATGFNYFKYDQTYESNGVVVNGLDNTKVTVPSTGTYNIQFSAVLSKTTANSATVEKIGRAHV